MAYTDGRSVVLERWLFDRLAYDALEVASMAGSIVGCGHSIATVAALEALGLLPEGESSGMPETVAVFRKELSAELVEAVGERIERGARSKNEERFEAYYRKHPSSRPDPRTYAYRHGAKEV